MEPKQRTIHSRIHDVLKSIDIYGTPITLTYKGQGTFKTFVGGIFTLITLVIVMSYFLSSITSIIEKVATV